MLQMPVFRYDEEEWEHLVEADPGWSRAETDYLLDMCERFELRFLVIADRYEVGAERTAARTSVSAEPEPDGGCSRLRSWSLTQRTLTAIRLDHAGPRSGHAGQLSRVDSARDLALEQLFHANAFLCT